MRRALTALLLLLPLAAQAGTLDDLLTEGVVVGYWDLRSGSTRDWSGTGNDATSTTSFNYTNRGGQFPASTSKITVADDATLQLTALSVTVCGDLTSQTAEALVHKQDAGGTNYSVALTSTNINLYDGTNTRTIAADITGHHCVTVQATNGSTGEAFIDGVLEGALDAASALSVDNAPLILGNDHDDGDNASNPLWCVVIVDRELTDAEAAGLYSQLSAIRWPTRGWYRTTGVYGPELVADGDMEAAGTAAWTPGQSATLTKEDGNVLAGTRVLRIAYNGANYPNAGQPLMLVGLVYRISGWARGDGTCIPAAQYDGGFRWVGTSATTWQAFDFIYVSDTQLFRLHSLTTAAGYSEFDNVSVREVESPEIQGATGWGAFESDDVAAGYIPGTPIEVVSGTWDVVVETVEGNVCKVLENDGAGIVYIPGTLFTGDSTQDARGTWSGWVYKTDAGAISIDLVAQADDTITAGDYVLEFAADESVILDEQGTGSIIAGGTITHSTWTSWKVSGDITDDGWSFDLAGSTVGTGSDGTQTESLGVLLDMDDGDKVVLGCREGGVGGITKRRGVW